MYSKCSATMSVYMDTLLCQKFHIPEIGLKLNDKNCEDTGTIDNCVLYPEKFFKGPHLQLNNVQSEINSNRCIFSQKVHDHFEMRK